MVTNDIARCARCILPASLPSAQLDEAGICAHCRAYDRLAAELERTKAEREQRLRQIVNQARQAARPYDCVVPLSGGKDSSYALYLCSKVYGLRCLCATLDNGYLTPNARANIENALNASGADHIVYRVNRDTMLPLYGLSMRNCGMFCPPCNRGIEVTMFAAAQAFRVPLVVMGHGTLPTHLSDGRMPEIFRGGDLAFFKEVMRGENLAGRVAPFLSHGHQPPALDILANRAAQLFPQGLPRKAWWSLHSRVRRVLRRSGLEKAPDPLLINIYDYVDTPEAEVRETLAASMGWQSADGTFEHLDCAVEEIKRYVQGVKFPELTSTTIRNSGLVRAGRMLREEALAIERDQLSNSRQPAMLEQFVSDLNITRAEFETLARQQG